MIVDTIQNTEQFRFLKFPHVLLFDNRYVGISNDAKLLYALMLDRTSLSARNHWYDKAEKLYIYYTIREIEETLQCGHNKALRILNELEKVQLIQRIRQGRGRPTKFYINRIAEQEVLTSEKRT